MSDTKSEYSLVEKLTDAQTTQLHALMQKQWWGGQRSLDDVRLMVKNSSLMLAMVDNTSDRLVGFCRVLTDFIFRATVYDVMVTKELHGTGLGKRMMNSLCDHPKLQQVSFIYLCCEPQMFAFYERWGFAVFQGRTELMLKVQREE